MIFHSFNHPVETNLSSVWNKREHGILHFTIDKFYDPWNKPAAQFYTLVVDVFIVSTRKVDALKRTSFKSCWRFNLINRYFPMMLHNKGISRRQFCDLFRF